MSLTTPDAIRTLQRKLYTKAKQEPAYRFYALYDKVWRADILMFAYRLVRANKGSPGVDGINFEDIEQKTGIDKFLSELAQDLKDKTYHPNPVRRVMIPKADGSQRPLGIPTIRDRVAQMAVKLIIEPIFEADFCPNSYGFRPKKSAHQAVDDIANALHQGYTNVIDADLSKYFDSIPHTKLLAIVAERVVDSAILHVIKLWLKAPVIGEDKDAAPGKMWEAVRPTAKGRRKAASFPRCWQTATCTCLTGSGISINCAENCKHTSSAMRMTSWCCAEAKQMRHWQRYDMCWIGLISRLTRARPTSLMHGRKALSSWVLK